jgi:nitroreductase
MPTVSNQREVTDAIRHVRQARQFSPQAVTDDELREMLEIARWTGSSRNTQPWHFIAISDKDQLQAISRLRTAINWVAGAPLAIAIVLDGDAEISEAYDEGRVTERLMIGAHVLGLGSGVAWFGDAEQQAGARRILGIPENHTARSVVVVGHPTSLADPRPGGRQSGRHPLSQIASRNRMGTPVE